MEKKTNEHRHSMMIDIKPIKAKGEGKVNEYNKKIRGFVEKLDENIAMIVKGHESDFLSAYKTIMNQIKIQMSRLRQNSDEQTAIVKNDQAVKDLQATLAWYQNEAVKLSDACSRLQSRYDRVKSKIQNYTVENSYLEQQVKMLMRQNQTLKKNLGKNPEERTQEKISTENSSSYSPFIELLKAKYEITNHGFLKSLEKFVDNCELAWKHKIIELDEDIQEIKRKIKKISAVNSAEFLKKNESEELFLECVDEMRKEIIRKKAKAYSIKRSGGFKQESFMNEREKLIESFVTNEETISFLYDKLFSASSRKNSASNFSSTLGFGISHSLAERVPAKESAKSSQSSISKQAIVVKGKLMISR